MASASGATGGARLRAVAARCWPKFRANFGITDFLIVPRVSGDLCPPPACSAADASGAGTCEGPARLPACSAACSAADASGAGTTRPDEGGTAAARRLAMHLASDSVSDSTSSRASVARCWAGVWVLQLISVTTAARASILGWPPTERVAARPAAEPSTRSGSASLEAEDAGAREATLGDPTQADVGGAPEPLSCTWRFP